MSFGWKNNAKLKPEIGSNRMSWRGNKTFPVAHFAQGGIAGEGGQTGNFEGQWPLGGDNQIGTGDGFENANIVPLPNTNEGQNQNPWENVFAHPPPQMPGNTPGPIPPAITEIPGTGASRGLMTGGGITPPAGYLGNGMWSLASQGLVPGGAGSHPTPQFLGPPIGSRNRNNWPDWMRQRFSNY